MKKNIVKILLILALTLTLSMGLFVLAACDEPAEEKIELSSFSEDRVYKLDISNTEFMGAPHYLMPIVKRVLFDDEQTYFEFKADGTAHAQLTTAKGLFSSVDSIMDLVNIVASDMTIDDIKAMISNIDLAEGLEFYAEPMFPGFTKCLEEGNADGAFKLIENTLGLNIKGVDFSKDPWKSAVLAMGQGYKNTGHLYLPSDILDILFSDPDLQLQLVADWDYSLLSLEGEDGAVHEGIYIGGPVAKEPEITQPFAIFTLGTNANGEDTLHLVIEFMNIDLALTRYTSEAAE